MISACERPEAAEVIRRRCAELGSELLEIAQFAKVSNLHNLDGRCGFDLALNGDCFSQLLPSMRGSFQLRNAVVAATAAWRLAREGFNIPRAAIVEGVHAAIWPGRLEMIHERPLVFLDGAHNPAAVREIADFLTDQCPGRRVRLVYGSMRDKAIGEISETLFPLAEEVYLTRPDHQRAATPEEILEAARCRPERVVIELDVSRALEKACRASLPEDVVLATGSLFLVGAIKKALAEGKLTLA